MPNALDIEMASADYAGPIHASSVVIDGKAVLLSGPSGVGKSDLALRLIDRGATMLCDDYTHISNIEGTLVGRPLPNIAGLLEVRGLGLIRIPHSMEAPIALVVQLLDINDPQPERMPLSLTKRILCGVELALLSIHSFEASAPLKIELALKNDTSMEAL